MKFAWWEQFALRETWYNVWLSILPTADAEFSECLSYNQSERHATRAHLTLLCKTTKNADIRKYEPALYGGVRTTTP